MGEMGDGGRVLAQDAMHMVAVLADCKRSTLAGSFFFFSGTETAPVLLNGLHFWHTVASFQSACQRTLTICAIKWVKDCWKIPLIGSSFQCYQVETCIIQSIDSFKLHHICKHYHKKYC